MPAPAPDIENKVVRKKTVDIPALMELGFSWGARHLSNHHTHNCETATVTGAPNGKCVGGWRQVEDRNVT